MPLDRAKKNSHHTPSTVYHPRALLRPFRRLPRSGLVPTDIPPLWLSRHGLRRGRGVRRARRRLHQRTPECDTVHIAVLRVNRLNIPFLSVPLPPPQRQSPTRISLQNSPIPLPCRTVPDAGARARTMKSANPRPRVSLVDRTEEAHRQSNGLDRHPPSVEQKERRSGPNLSDEAALRPADSRREGRVRGGPDLDDGVGSAKAEATGGGRTGRGGMHSKRKEDACNGTGELIHIGSTPNCI